MVEVHFVFNSAFVDGLYKAITPSESTAPKNHRFRSGIVPVIRFRKEDDFHRGDRLGSRIGGIRKKDFSMEMIEKSFFFHKRLKLFFQRESGEKVIHELKFKNSGVMG